MRVLAVFALAGGLSGVAATVMLFILTDNLFVWLLLGHLFVAALWIATWITRDKSVRISAPGLYVQLVLSLVGWPLVLLAGVLGLFLAQAVSLPLLGYPLASYACAAIMAFALGAFSLQRRGAVVSSTAWLIGLLADFIVLLIALVVFQRLDVPRSSISNHYEASLCLIVFVPLAILDASFYGLASSMPSSS